MFSPYFFILNTSGPVLTVQLGENTTPLFYSMCLSALEELYAIM